MIVRTLGKYLDVVSVNYYTATTIAPDFISEISALAGDKPVLLSEWSYGTPERGHTGGIHNVNTQAERGRFYARYVRDAVKHPAVVGAHWYEYVDQAVTGRYVGGDRAERCNAGLVDIADHPYYDFLGLVIKANHHIYKSITP